MPIDFSDPIFLRFYKESLDKERELCAHWFAKNREELLTTCNPTKPQKGWEEKDIDKAKQELGMEALSQFYKDTYGNRRQAFGMDGEILGLKASEQFSQKRNLHPKIYEMIAEEHAKSCPGEGLEKAKIMKPIDPDIQKIIYGSLPEKGRLKYMKIRNKIPPDQKYYFEECTYWNYGWRPEENEIEPLPRLYGRKAVITSAFARSNATIPDPGHYVEPLSAPNKCIMY